MKVEFKKTDLLALVLLAVFFWNPEWPTLGPDVPDVPAPSAELQALVKPVAELLAGYEQTKEFSAFYVAFADVVERDGKGEKILGNSLVVREYNRQAMDLMWQGRWQKVPGLSAAVDGVLLQHAGDDPKLEDTQRAKLVAALRAVAWAAQEAK